jgi:hypothetical protein
VEADLVGVDLHGGNASAQPTNLCSSYARTGLPATNLAFQAKGYTSTNPAPRYTARISAATLSLSR